MPLRKKRILLSFSVLVFWLIIWQVLSMAVAKEVLIPSPLLVGRRFLQLCGTSSFWFTIGLSCLRVVIGLCLSLVIGVFMGTLCARFSLLDILFRPLLRIITATPVASFIILALVWIKTNRLPIFITFLMVLPVVWNNIYQGYRSVDKQLLEMTKVFNLSFRKRWNSLYLPSILPYLRAALTVGISYAWKAGIAAEIIAQPALSIGKQIHNSKIYLETTDLFAWTLAVILLSFLLERCSRFLLALTKGGNPVADRD